LLGGVCKTRKRNAMHFHAPRLPNPARRFSTSSWLSAVSARPAARLVMSDTAAKKITDETLEVNGKPHDLKAGRVFLVDLTAQPPTVEQIAVALSGPAASDGNIEGAALQARNKVTKSNEAARKFVGPTE
jgi:hypothetical protein